MIATALSVLALLAPADRAAVYPPVEPAWGTTTTGLPAVLWSDGDRMYNSNPADPVWARAHYDVLRWEGDWLRYHGTYAVAPLAETAVTFTPAIRYMPRYGNRQWGGTSTFSSEAGGGYVIYTGSMVGGRLTIREWLVWDADSRYGGGVTEWQEDWLFSDTGLVRAWGGNVSAPESFWWDITFG